MDNSFFSQSLSLVEVQLVSFRWFQEQGLHELLLVEFSSIEDLTGTQYELRFLNYELRPPRHSQQECRTRDMTYSAPLYANTQLISKKTGEIKEQQIFMGDFPIMTPDGTFVINGTERVEVSQLVRSPGVYFTMERDMTSGRGLCHAKLIPTHGAWVEFETSAKNIISVKVEGKRKIPVTSLLRAIGYTKDKELLGLLADVDTSLDRRYIQSTLEKETLLRAEPEFAYQAGSGRASARNAIDSMQLGGTSSTMSAASLTNNLFSNPRHYRLGKVGRHKLNKKLGRELLLIRGLLDNEAAADATIKEIDELTAEHFFDKVLAKEDLVAIVWHMIAINNGVGVPDDINHLTARRVRAVGEQIQNQLRIGMLRLERIIKERMSLVTQETVTVSGLINIRPVITALRELFAGSQLSQFMDQTNPLAALTHKRRISALGPGGLSRERAGFEVRDVHYSHYGRICPIETPEGPNIGLISALATYARVNEFGFIETPYRQVIHQVDNEYKELLNRILLEAVPDDNGGVIAKAGTRINSDIAKSISALSSQTIKVMPFASDEIIYLDAAEEKDRSITQANTRLDPDGNIVDDKVEIRKGSKTLMEAPNNVELMDLSPKQMISITTALIPFLEHDDANRALMGANMQRQAVPLLRADPPLVGTGMERLVAQNTGLVINASDDGEVISATGSELIFVGENGETRVYPLAKFQRTNQSTCLSQKTTVSKGAQVCKGQTLVDSSATREGGLTLGQNVLCAFMSWRGYNFEDAIIISENLVKEDKFSSIHIEKFEIEAQDTKLGPEEITRDIPGVGEESLRNLDESGIVFIGAEVGPGDILVGKITPKGEAELTAEEKLLRALFGEKARRVRDSSLRMPSGERGTIINTAIFSREKRDELPAGVDRLVRVWVAQKRKVTEGDKLTGRHGNKGVIAHIVPIEDMPFLPDGRSVDIILNPVGVPSRMNLGQLLETHLGWAAHALGFKATTPVFEGVTNIEVEAALAQSWIVRESGAISPQEWIGEETPPIHWDVVETWLAERGSTKKQVFEGTTPTDMRKACLEVWLRHLGVNPADCGNADLVTFAENVSHEKRVPVPTHGKITLCDGFTGEPFDEPVTVGYIYMMKLNHLVEDKIHSRSTGPYSLVTQQPLGGKAQFGGQRFGEMEAWALEAYGAAYTLQELLTIKSDDVIGRAKAYEAIIKGEDTLPPNIPESFNVLTKELQSLGLAMEPIYMEELDGFIEDIDDSGNLEEIDSIEENIEQLEDKEEYA